MRFPLRSAAAFALALDLVVSVFVARPAGAARAFNGTSSDYASTALDLSAYNKLTVTYWLWWNSNATNDDRLAFEDSCGSAFYSCSSSRVGFTMDQDSSTDAGKAGLGIAAGTTSVMTTAAFTRPSAGAWHEYVFLFDATASGSSAIPTAYVDGVAQSLTYHYSSFTPQTAFNATTMYLMTRAGTSLFGAGRMADFAICGGVLLSQAQASALAAGARPWTVCPGSLAFYIPMDGIASPEPDLSGHGQNVTIHGTTLTGAPPFLPLMPPRGLQ